ncbi:MAG: amino acid adenylation domain-containing protein [Bryobacterales bacterium]|nr:amino acid adenylation domain-containing protein [Bryobacterales bacterium]
MTYAQRQLWFLNELDRENVSYNIPWSIRLIGELHVEALEQSLNEIVRRHEILRTTFGVVNGEPVQKVAEQLWIPLRVTSIEHLHKPEREPSALALAAGEARRPFDVANGPLLRAQLIRLSPADHVFLLTLHHIIFDGPSRRVFAQELAALYEAFKDEKPSGLPDIRLQYADYAIWQREYLKSAASKKDLAYWKQQLTGAPACTEIPTDRPRPAIQTSHGAAFSVAFPKKLSERLAVMSREHGASLFMTLLTGFQALLSRYTGQTDIVVGTPVANRGRAETEAIIGLFANTLALRADLSGNPEFGEMVERVKATTLKAYAHQEFPFEKVVEELNPERRLSHNPLYQVVFVLGNSASHHFELSGLELQVIGGANTTAKFDISVLLSNSSEGLRGRIEYRTDLFDASTIDRMIGHYRMILEAVAENPRLRLSELPLLTAPEREQIVNQWNATEAEYPRHVCLHQLFEQQAARTPEAIACICGEQRLSYGELNARANQLARTLQRRGAGPGQRVGVFLERTPALVVALLGVQKSGAAYVPIDPAYPTSLISQILDEAKVCVLVTEPDLRQHLPQILVPAVICMEHDAALFAEQAEAKPESGVGPDDAVYVMFTLGSDRQLKGVQTPHRAVVNLLNSMARELKMGPADVFPALASSACDMSVPELYLALITGGCVSVGRAGLATDGRRLAEFLRASGATVVQATPETWRLLVDAGFDGHGLKRLCGAGELAPELCTRLLEGDASFYNFYGPTEATVWSAFHRVFSTVEAGVVGRPVSNNRIYILDEHQRPVPVGIVGEIYVAGDGLADGYLQQPELTAARFLPEPPRAGGRMYRTGDLGKFLPDGKIQWLRRKHPATGILHDQLVFWKRELAGAPAMLPLPTDGPRSANLIPKRAQCQMWVPGALRVGLAQLGEREGVNLFVSLLSAFSVLLSRYSDQDEIVVGVLRNGRKHPDNEKLLDLFPNPLPLRIVVSGGRTFRQLLHHVRDIELSAEANQDIPFDQLIKHLQLQCDPTCAPLFQTMFMLEDATRTPCRQWDISRFDLTMIAAERAEGLRITFEYNANLFEAATVLRMQKHLENLLQAAIDQSERDIARMPLLGTAELQQQLEQWNATEQEYSRDACVPDLLMPVVRQSPRRTAVICGGRQISYRNLNDSANRLARYLQKRGLRTGSLVGVFLPRSIEMVVALLGILKAGGAYVPLDPAHPKKRLALLLEDSNATILVTQRSISELLPVHPADRIYLDDDWTEISGEPASELTRAASPDDRAYVMFTSGSTGRPKGVEITHRNLVNFLQSMQQKPGFSAADTLLAVTTLSFDIAGLEIFLPLISGGRVVIASREEAMQVDKLKHVLSLSNATVMQATPATWRMLIESGWEGNGHLTAFCGGEALAEDLASELLLRVGALWNMYGPTETTIWSSVFKVESGRSGIVPIGRPIGNTQLYILDKYQRPVPVGVVGELYIGGLGVARGYLNREELTASKFLPDPFRPAGRMYRTGDRARFLPHGTVQFLGRADDQVKLFGYRIEPGEIESVLRECSVVKDCVVVMREEAQGPRLVAYVVPRAPEGLNATELVNHLKKVLPNYMVPSVVILESLPLTPAGKVDRRALPAPDTDPLPSTDRVEPRDEFETALIDIWKRLFNFQNCSVTANFFELGGYSLLLVRLQAMIEKDFGQTVPLSFLFESATIEKIAGFLRDKCADKSGFFLPFNETGSGPTFFCVHSLVGDALKCRHLARFLDPAQRFYGIQIPPKLRTPEFVSSVAAIARRYVAEILAFQPEGPYVLGGWSAGVPIALEMAQQLKEAGHEVALLVSIDSAMANTGAGSRRFSLGYCQKIIRNVPRWVADDLAQRFSWSRVVRGVIHKSRGIIKRIAVAGGDKDEIAKHRAEIFVSAGAFSESTNKFMKALYITLGRYVPKPYTGPTVLYMARTEPLFGVRELDLKWKKIATDLEIVQVKGSHLTVLDESNVGLLAQDLNARLRQCRQRALSNARNREREFERSGSVRPSSVLGEVETVPAFAGVQPMEHYAAEGRSVE